MIGQVVELVIDRRADATTRPFVVGIAGGVGVGKTTLAEALAEGLDARGVSTRVLASDNFLFPNEVLASRGLLMQKGFPETYDVVQLGSVVERLRRGEDASVPVYDHQTYDILPDRRRIEPTDVLILEGVNILQPGVVEHVDLSMYVDVDVSAARAWFLERFSTLCAAGEGFYAAFASMSPAERDAIADSAWSGINLVNLERHIAPSAVAANVLIRKEWDHSIVSVDTA